MGKLQGLVQSVKQLLATLSTILVSFHPPDGTLYNAPKTVHTEPGTFRLTFGSTSGRLSE